MKETWLKVDNFNKELITTAIEKGINGFLVDSKDISGKIENLGKVNTYVNGKDTATYIYKNQDDEDKIVELGKKTKLILESKSWEIIPWENLIAKNAKFYVNIKTLDELKSAIGVLEKGVYGIILDVDEMDVLIELITYLDNRKDVIPLKEAEITNVKVLDSGDRVCIDTCNLMTLGEGMLIGTSSECLFLIHSESIENPYCAPRPFRVNAGGVYAYVKTSSDKTKYLSEVSSGDDILIVDYKGNIRKGIVGRSKIEKRPLILIEAEVDNKNYSVILQNAETINLVNVKGEPISVTKLNKGDKVLVNIEKGGRHFGRKIEESIIEK